MDSTEQADANNTQQQNVTEAVARLLTASDQSNGTEEEKVAAKSKVTAFLHGANTAVAEGGARALIERFKN